MSNYVEIIAVTLYARLRDASMQGMQVCHYASQDGRTYNYENVITIM